MTIEKELCKAVVGVFQEMLNDVEIHGNWIPDDDIKGVDVYEGRRLDVNVSARKYDGYSSPMAEMSVTLEAEFAAEDDITLAETVSAYESVIGKLEEWHHDIAAVKRDLTLTNQLPTTNQPTTIFVPVGLKVDGGQPIEIDRETKTRSFTQQFTIKGRIST